MTFDDSTQLGACWVFEIETTRQLHVESRMRMRINDKLLLEGLPESFIDRFDFIGSVSLIKTPITVKAVARMHDDRWWRLATLKIVENLFLSGVPLVFKINIDPRDPSRN